MLTEVINALEKLGSLVLLFKLFLIRSRHGLVNVDGVTATTKLEKVHDVCGLQVRITFPMLMRQERNRPS